VASSEMAYRAASMNGGLRVRARTSSVTDGAELCLPTFINTPQCRIP